MAGNQKAAIAYAVEKLNEVDRSGRSGQFFKEQTEKMSLADFTKFVERCENGEDYVSVIMQLNDTKSITVENNKKVAKKWGVKLYQRFWQVNPATGVEFLSPNEHPCYYLPVRRQIETIEYKISYSSSNMKIDAITGQVIGNDQASRMSYPEVMVVYSKELNYSLIEFMKYRGGDVQGRVEFNNLLRNTGGVSLDNLLRTKTTVKSTESLQVYFLAMHWDVNLVA